MAINYPDFRADPNAAPQLNALPSLTQSLQKGYMLAQLPQQLKMQRALQQSELERNQMQNYYYPQMQDAQLAQTNAATQGQVLQNNAFPSLSNAQIEQIKALTGQAMAGTRLTNQEANLYEPLTRSQIAKNMADLNRTDNGITVGVDENGRPLVQIGGSSKGGTGSMGGKLMIDADGNVISQPTRQNTSKIQNAQLGEETAAPFIDQIIKSMPQFQTPGKRFERGVASAANMIGLGNFANAFGVDTNLPSQYAQGLAAINTAAEGLLSASNLNSTEENLNKFIKNLTPLQGESQSGYRNRVKKFYNTIQFKNMNTAKKLASGFNTGINVNGPQANSQPQRNPALAHLSDEEILAGLQ